MYDSRSDHATWQDIYGADSLAKPWEYASRNSSVSLKRFLKRARSKANRRLEIPQQAMRAYGYGRDNYGTWS